MNDKLTFILILLVVVIGCTQPWLLLVGTVCFFLWKHLETQEKEKSAGKTDTSAETTTTTTEEPTDHTDIPSGSDPFHPDNQTYRKFRTREQ